MFALVEDETLHTLNLSSNPELSRTTGKSLIKVLEGTNEVLKKISLSGTNVSTMCKIDRC